MQVEFESSRDGTFIRKPLPNPNHPISRDTTTVTLGAFAKKFGHLRKMSE